MKIIISIVLFLTTLVAAKPVDVGERFSDSAKCKACHLHIVKEWEESWHAKSHYDNDEYLRATTDYVSRKTRKSLNGVKVQCATCHNPRISVTKTGIDYEIMAVMNLDKNSDVNKALEDDKISEGINCVVCHNIDKIHLDKDDNVRGINRVSWTRSGIMTGPYDDAKSPYHNVEHRDFMSGDSNKLCFVCHANDRSVEGLVFTNMQEEYQEGGKSCVDCHMGAKKEGIAASLKIDNGKPRVRDIRSHGFAGAHSESLWKDALNLSVEHIKGETYITIANPHPHNIPSGFGAREIVVEVLYKNNQNIVEKKTISLTRNYVSKRGKPTIPHLAVEATKDLSIPANGKRVLKVSNETPAQQVEVQLFYKLVNDEVHSILELKEPIWSKRFPITSKTIKVK
ncbi:MAG: multiheme c-type cytochrome [Sulfurimonadaceae bacterium]|jgi:nitrate/TMAO reductase-like tetraheme cytochrome c subunit|nr:multiheme c-type cytochrome [Sulfurimonadaceae bacterium]